MSIDEAIVKQIAHLARINIEESDFPNYVNDMNNILKLVNQVSQLDTDNTPPMAHPIPTSQRLREDKVTERDQRDYYQTIAPQTEGGP